VSERSVQRGIVPSLRASGDNRKNSPGAVPGDRE
jgi:hypothetical protein